MQLAEELIKSGIPVDRVKAFLNYHKENPDIWAAFEKFTLDCISRRKKLGANAIRERIRWEVEIVKNGEFKFNNNYTPLYARAFAIKHPKYESFFAYRDLKL